MLIKLLFFPIKLVLKVLLWLALLPIRMLLAPIKMALKLVQLVIFLGIVGVIIFVVVQYVW